VHLALALEDEEALLDVAIADLVPVDRDLLAGVDLGGPERQLRRSLRRIEVDRAANTRDEVAERLVGAIRYAHPARPDVISGSLYASGIPGWACLNGDIARLVGRPNSGPKVSWEGLELGMIRRPYISASVRDKLLRLLIRALMGVSNAAGF
jgi:hypothetical protein